MTPTLMLVGGPTALIEYGGERLLTDPGFDPPREYLRPESPVVLRKLAGPAVSEDELGQVDAVLLSHDHHSDNLDDAGRAFLARAGRVLTTLAGAGRLGGNAVGLEPGDRVEVGAIQVTAVPAEHGPPEIAPLTGPVIGFVLSGDGLPKTYVSGDNSSVDVVRAIVSEHGPFASAVLFVGGAHVPEIFGEAKLTLTAEAAVEATRALGEATIVPIHQDGWAHFSSSADDVESAFAAAGLAGRLRAVRPGETVTLV
jgi:L-ascorbate metabolism protein UlaG (beta-lactamase superfamily)